MKTLIKKIIPDTLYEFIWRCYFRFLTAFYSLFPIKKNKVFISSYYGADFGDNGKYIVEELLKSHKDLDIVWQLKRPLLSNNRLPQGVRAVEYYSRKAIYEAQTSAVWVDNARKNFGNKRKGQFYIQTWHGGPGIKRSEKDVENHLSERYVAIAKKDSKMCDVLLSNCDFMTEYFKKVFWYDGEIACVGSPRNDILVANKPEIKQKVYEFFGVNNDVKLVLYAPTFRSNENLDVYNLDYECVCRALQTRFGGEWKLLLRLHPNISDKAELMKSSDKVIPATAYPDMQELLVAVDCLITDYSSSSFDFLINKRPTFLYTPDLDDYRDDRGFLFELDSLPFPLAQNNDDFCNAILNFDNEAYVKTAEELMKKTGYKEKGTASSSVAKMILEHIGL